MIVSVSCPCPSAGTLIRPDAGLTVSPDGGAAVALTVCGRPVTSWAPTLTVVVPPGATVTSGVDRKPIAGAWPVAYDGGASCGAEPHCWFGWADSV